MSTELRILDRADWPPKLAAGELGEVLRIYGADDELVVEHPLTDEACLKLAEDRVSLRKDCECPVDLHAYLSCDA